VIAAIGGEASADGCHDGHGSRGRDCGWAGHGRSGCRNTGAYSARAGRSHTYYPSWWGARPSGTSYGGVCDAVAVRLGAPCAAYAPRCGYRFHRGPRWASLVYDRRAYAWPSFGQVGDVGDDDDAADAAPAVPLGPRAQAHEALFSGDLENAEAKFRALTVADPADAAAWIGVAHACFSRIDYAGAVEALDRAATLGAISPAQRLDIPATYADPEVFRRRFDAVRLRVRWSALDTDAHTVLSWLEAGTGDARESLAEARYVLRDRPSSACARVLAGLPPEPPATAETPAPAPAPAGPTETATK
jgi:tetratricopeptide (TPR) repeat protein